MDDTHPPVYVVSGGVGASGEQIVNSVLVQFPDREVPVIVVPHVRQSAQVRSAVDRAAATGGTIVHTMVDGPLREELERLSREQGIVTLDLMGDLIERLSAVLGREPLGQPGLYRQLKRDYFERVASIDFAMVHDDGQNPEGWKEAEIVLVGVSRAGKTPLTMFLAVLGWRVANVPLVEGIPVPKALDEVDRRRVIALDIDPAQLSLHRHHRQRELGVRGRTHYTDAEALWSEVTHVRKEVRHRGFARIDVTDKPMETLADEVIRKITSRLGEEARR
jgi:regulator of PEP synthase PpsR (kinase-PPPase family)